MSKLTGNGIEENRSTREGQDISHLPYLYSMGSITIAASPLDKPEMILRGDETALLTAQPHSETCHDSCP